MDWRVTYPAVGRIRGNRMTIAARFRLWKRRRKHYDLENLKGW